MADITCDHIASTITLDARLDRNGAEVSSQTRTKHNKLFLKNYAAVRCSGMADRYQDVAKVVVILPPGAIPGAGERTKMSGEVTIRC